MPMPPWLRDPRHRAVFALAPAHGVLQCHHSLLGLVDTWVIGHLGEAWFLGGVSVGATLINLLFWLLGFLRMSTTGLTAQAQGAANAEGQLDTPARALGLAIGLGWHPAAVAAVPAGHHRPWAGLGGGTGPCRGLCVGADLSAPAALCNLGDHGLAAGHAGCAQPHAAADPGQPSSTWGSMPGSCWGWAGR